jgi:deoxyribose-phosphate aldolase
MLAALRQRPDTSCGLKVSGGIRTLADARIFLELVAETMGQSWLDPVTFRLGASALLDDIERVLGDKSSQYGDQRK